MSPVTPGTPDLQLTKPSHQLAATLNSLAASSIPQS
ncbi:hypothetical protein HDA39_002966 [Kribbella italica]|uniref:Uncharacterized protein n=1 Tax=Kribbella italica TaxID=1540520 RepID=A0A7W9J6W0_9ACTN|nr:hypothetical protein [Kribbella italica]